MKRIWHAVRAAAVIALSGCAGAPADVPVARAAPPARVAPVITAAPLSSLTSLAAMRGALPTFDLQPAAATREVSIVRDLVFEPGSSILSRTQVDQLEPLKAYLRANPAVAVRIEGYGDGGEGVDREGYLSLNRAQAVTRALLTDVQIGNDIASVEGASSGTLDRRRRADVTFIMPAVLTP